MFAKDVDVILDKDSAIPVLVGFVEQLLNGLVLPTVFQTLAHNEGGHDCVSYLAIISKLLKRQDLNDPLGQTHSENCFALIFYKNGTDGWTYERTTCAKTMIPTARDCGLAEWIKKKFR